MWTVVDLQHTAAGPAPAVPEVPSCPLIGSRLRRSRSSRQRGGDQGRAEREEQRRRAPPLLAPIASGPAGVHSTVDRCATQRSGWTNGSSRTVVPELPRRSRVPRSRPRCTAQTTSGSARAAVRKGHARRRIWRSLPSPASSGSNPRVSEDPGHDLRCLLDVDRAGPVPVRHDRGRPGQPGLLGPDGSLLRSVGQLGRQHADQHRVAAGFAVPDRGVDGAGTSGAGPALRVALDQPDPA